MVVFAIFTIVAVVLSVITLMGVGVAKGLLGVD